MHSGECRSDHSVRIPVVPQHHEEHHFNAGCTTPQLCVLCRRTGWLDQDQTPFCQAMVELGLAGLGIPERLHPKSLHAMFAHNTNVWATRNKQVTYKA